MREGYSLCRTASMIQLMLQGMRVPDAVQREGACCAAPGERVLARKDRHLRDRGVQVTDLRIYG
jgi:hypothetical protein